MAATTSAENLRQYKIRFPLIAEQILTFISHPNMVRQVKVCLQISTKLHDGVYIIEDFHLDSQIHFIAKL